MKENSENITFTISIIFIDKILDYISTSTVFWNYCHLYVVFFDQINMFKSMFSLYFYYLNYTINTSPPFKATPPFKQLENRL